MPIKLLVVLSLSASVIAGAPLVFMAAVCLALVVLCAYQAVVEVRAA